MKNTKLKNMILGAFILTMILGVIGLGSSVITITDTEIQGYGAKESSCVVATDSTGDQTDVQDCIDAIDTGQVVVKDGVYNIESNITIKENVSVIGDKNVVFNMINSSVKMTGENTELKNIIFENSANYNTYVVDVSACDGVKIRDNTFNDIYKHGVYLHGCDSDNGLKIVENNRIEGFGYEGTGYAIYIDYSPNTWILNNFINQTSSGCACDAIEMGHSGKIKTLGNTVIGTDSLKVAINYPFASDSQICNNEIYNGGIHNDNNNADNVIICNNMIKIYNSSSYYGAIRMSGENGQIYGNNIETWSNILTGGGIFVYGNNTMISQNNIIGNETRSGEGIFVNGFNNLIIGNRIENINKSVNLVKDNNKVISNSFYNTHSGVSITASTVSGWTAKNNTIKDNTYNQVTTKIDTGNAVQQPNNLFDSFLYDASVAGHPPCDNDNEYSHILKTNSTGEYYSCYCIADEWRCQETKPVADKYVLNTGDTMTGEYTITPDSANTGFTIDMDHDAIAQYIDQDSSNLALYSSYGSAGLPPSGYLYAANYFAVETGADARAVAIRQKANQQGLLVLNDGTSVGILVDQDGQGIGLSIDSEATAKVALAMDGGGCAAGQYGFYRNTSGIYVCYDGTSTKLNS